MNFFDRLFPGFLSKARSIFGYSTYDASVVFNDNYRSTQKLNAVLSSPAVLKVIALQCDLFSLGKIKVLDQDNNEIPDDPFLKLINKPNHLVSNSQFLWDFMLWTMLGTDYCHVTSQVIDDQTKMHMLDPAKIEWPTSLDRKRDHFVFSDQAYEELMNTTITYRYSDGTCFQFPLRRLIVSADLTNGVGNFFKSPSRIDAIYKIISNSDAALDSKNINVRYNGKFLVGSANQLQSTGLGQDEKEDIIDKMETHDKNVFPLKTMVNIKRFVESVSSTGLSESYLADYFLIGNMFNIPRDVLEAYASATYENQEKSRMSHVSYTLQPKGNEWMDQFEKFFGYDRTGKNIVISWDHLPFMQVFEKDKADKEKSKIESFKALIDMGVSVDNANAYLGTTFEIEAPEQVASSDSSVNIATTSEAQDEGAKAQSQLRASVGGVTGVLSIINSVAQGITSYDAALAILMIIYGFPEDQALNLLGPKPTQIAQDNGTEQQPAGAATLSADKLARIVEHFAKQQPARAKAPVKNKSGSTKWRYKREKRGTEQQ